MIHSSLSSSFLYLTTLSTHPTSNLLTPSLNASTSFQQSKGLLSLPLKHFTTSSLALSTAASSSPISLTFFLFSNFSRSFATSLETASRPRERRASPAEEASVAGRDSPVDDESPSRRELRVASSRACRRLSSSATRDWM